jgi:hypothetical protein
MDAVIFILSPSVVIAGVRSSEHLALATAL